MQKLLSLVFLVIVVAVSGCGQSKTGLEMEFDGKAYEDPKEAANTHKLIEQLKGVRLQADPVAQADYHEAKETLIQKGNKIQGQLLEALHGHKDWGVRLGTLHVLDAVGDKRSVEDLIRVLMDDHPLVSHKALFSLRGWTSHKLIPETGVGASGLPALPQPDRSKGEDHALVWTQWQARHGQKLHDTWLSWWAENKRSVSVQ